MTSVLVTGGAGYIGSYLVQKLQEQHTKVLLLDICAPDFVHADFYPYDVAEDAWLSVVPPVKTIYHLAAVSRIGDAIDAPGKTFHTNVIGTRNVLEFARRHQANVVYISTSCCAEADLQLTPYHYSKWLGEQACHYYQRYEQVAVGIARLFNVYGSHDFYRRETNLVMEIFECKKRADKPLPLMGNGTQQRDFVHISDVAAALMRIGEIGDSNEIFNIGTGVLHSIQQIAAYFGGPIEHIPGRFFDVEKRVSDIGSTKSRLHWSAEIAVRDYIRERMES